MPNEIQEGSYVKHRGKLRIVSKHYKPSPSHKKLPPVEARNHGDQNDLGIDPVCTLQLVAVGGWTQCGSFADIGGVKWGC